MVISFVSVSNKGQFAPRSSDRGNDTEIDFDNAMLL